MNAAITPGPAACAPAPTVVEDAAEHRAESDGDKCGHAEHAAQRHAVGRQALAVVRLPQKEVAEERQRRYATWNSMTRGLRSSSRSRRR
jgi:hypothetical protein